MFYILITVVVTQAYTFVETHRYIDFKWEDFIVYTFSSNKCELTICSLLSQCVACGLREIGTEMPNRCDC